HRFSCVFLCWFRPPPVLTLFPYTTLFRSVFLGASLLLLHWKCLHCGTRVRAAVLHDNCDENSFRRLRMRLRFTPDEELFGAKRRSEEHTSELQSRENLVCRLLLEKKKTKT